MLAPLTNPAISTNSIRFGIIFSEEAIFDNASNPLSLRNSGETHMLHTGAEGTNPVKLESTGKVHEVVRTAEDGTDELVAEEFNPRSRQFEPSERSIEDIQAEMEDHGGQEAGNEETSPSSGDEETPPPSTEETPPEETPPEETPPSSSVALYHPMLLQDCLWSSDYSTMPAASHQQLLEHLLLLGLQLP